MLVWDAGSYGASSEGRLSFARFEPNPNGPRDFQHPRRRLFEDEFTSLLSVSWCGGGNKSGSRQLSTGEGQKGDTSLAQHDSGGIVKLTLGAVMLLGLTVVYNKG
jgi:hypothetical protein